MGLESVNFMSIKLVKEQQRILSRKYEKVQILFALLIPPLHICLVILLSPLIITFLVLFLTEIFILRYLGLKTAEPAYLSEKNALHLVVISIKDKIRKVVISGDKRIIRWMCNSGISKANSI